MFIRVTQSTVTTLLLLAALASCSTSHPPAPDELTFLIESAPANLDPRIGADAQSQRISSLIFSGLLARDASFDLVPDLALSWSHPDPLTYIFHLRPGVTFHDARPLTSADVKFTLDSIRSGSLRTPKRGAFRLVSSVEAPDPLTVIIRLSEPYASFLYNVARPAIGIVPVGSPDTFAAHPIGSGPFRFISAAQDDFLLLERFPGHFGDTAGVRVQYVDINSGKRTCEVVQVPCQKMLEIFGGKDAKDPRVQRIRFRIVPDATTRALELRKGSADLALSSLSPDAVHALAEHPASPTPAQSPDAPPAETDNALIEVRQSLGSNIAYLALNCSDPILARREVRQALAYATDRYAIVKYLLRNQAEVSATSILPLNHWVFNPEVPFYRYDPARAEALLDAAGFPRPSPNSPRLRLALKTSTDEQARLIGAVLQDQWRKIGVELDLRPLELATLLADANRGAFQLTYLRWVGANSDPDIFEFVFSSKRFPPDGANRGRYSNPLLDQILARARIESNRDARRRLYFEAQQILAADMPYIYLWYPANVAVFRRRVDLPYDALSPAGDYDFLRSISLRPPTSP